MIKDFRTDQAAWIGHPAKATNTTPNEYYEFSRSFSLDEVVGTETMEISVDSDYAIWINGEFLNLGQYSDTPTYKVYDELSIGSYLTKGENKICILVYCQGESSNKYFGGICGLLYSIHCKNKKIVSDSSTLVRRSSTYHNGPTSRNQMGFTFAYDGNQEDSWTESGLESFDHVYSAAILEDFPSGYQLNKRPVKKLKLGERITANIIAQGSLKRVEEKTTSSQTMFEDYLSSRRFHQIIDGKETLSQESLEKNEWNKFIGESMEDSDGAYLVIDLGQQEVGLLDFCIDAKAGTILDIVVGEHLEDLRVRSYIGHRNFGNRYICKSGVQHFTHYFSRYGGRYIQVHILGSSLEDFAFSYIGLRRAEYPIDYFGKFKTSDSLHNKIHDVAVRTLRLCMFEHYEDTPWREQALYALDSRNQALCGYYCFGEYSFSKASLQLLGKSLRKDGYLELNPPGKAPITIPIFTLAFIKSLEEYVLYSGDIDFAQENKEIIKTILDTQISRLKNNILVTPAEVDYWNFYEWAHDLHGEPIIREEPLEYRLDAPLNLFFIIALDSASRLMNYCGEGELSQSYSKLATDTRKECHKIFFDSKKGLYKNYVGLKEYDSYSELTQALALYTDIVPKEEKAFILDTLCDEENELTKVTLSQSIFKYEALLQGGEKYREKVFEQIGKDWGHMLYQKATSFWETLNGAKDFDHAGSLCHGWSAIPAYLYYAYVLGIKPLEPGFKKVDISPISGGFYKAEGKIKTPLKEIEVSWIKDGENIKIINNI